MYIVKLNGTIYLTLVFNVLSQEEERRRSERLVQHVVQPPETPAELPQNYQALAEIFQSTDKIVSLHQCRHKTCTFSSLRVGVQQMTGK